MERALPSLTWMSRRWSRKSKSTWKTLRPRGMVDVVSPRAVTVKATCHHPLRKGRSASFTLPTIWVHMWRVSSVSFHSS
jgi:hypothetical protein